MAKNEPDSTEVEITTEFGRLRVARWLLATWQMNGWPTDTVLRRMVEEQKRGGGR